MKHLYRLLIFCTVFLLLVLPYASVAQEDEAYYEGLEFHRRQDPVAPLFGVHIRALKQVDGDWRQSEVHIDANIVDDPSWIIRYQVNTTFTVPEDADWLEVSDDLGWSGLDTQVWIPLQIVTCPEIGEECTTATEMVFAEINITGWANEPVIHYEREGEYNRDALFTGTVTIMNHTVSINEVEGYNFSNLYSEEDWP